jgi:predicted permease membrane protein
MPGVFHFLQAQPFIAIFGVVAIGMALGKRSIGGVSLGSVVRILIVGLPASIWSYNATGTSLALPDVLKSVFFNMFIFAMGVKIGPQFFAGLQRDGWHMVTIGLIVAVIAPAISYLCGWVFHRRREPSRDCSQARTTRRPRSAPPHRRCSPVPSTRRLAGRSIWSPERWPRRSRSATRSAKCSTSCS